MGIDVRGLGVLGTIIEMVRPELSGFAGFSVRISEATLAVDGRPRTVTVQSPLFGGIKRIVELRMPGATHDAKALEDSVIKSIVHGVAEIVAEAELHALVDYKWPKAA